MRSPINLNSNAISAPTFNFTTTIKSIFRDILLMSGSAGGTVAFIESRDLPGLAYKFDATAGNNLEIRDSSIKDVHLSDDEFLRGMYLESLDGNDWVYISEHDPRTPIKLPNGQLVYHRFSSLSIKSVLATKIYSDGEAVGVISIESTIPDAFTEGHLIALKGATATLGFIFKEYEIRSKTLREIGLRDNAERFQQAMDSCQRLKGFEISYLFYEIDHRTGTLTARFDKSKLEVEEEVFAFNFEDQSLATLVLASQEDLYIEKATDDRPSKLGVHFFSITGSIYAAPIRVGRYISFVLVAWSRKAKPLKPVCNRIYRLAHFIVNSPDRSLSKNILRTDDKAMQFIAKMNQVISVTKVRKSEFSKNALGVIKKLLQSLHYCSIFRVRLWLFNPHTQNFECIYSSSISDIGKISGAEENKYKGRLTDASDSYCRYTINRYEKNQFAMHQHRQMFSEYDKNTDLLDKDPEGKWIVGPVVYDKVLLGYISTDNHILDSHSISKEKALSEEYDAFQRYAVDLVADILGIVLKLYSRDLFEARQGDVLKPTNIN
jgi:hypothetical protein